MILLEQEFKLDFKEWEEFSFIEGTACKKTFPTRTTAEQQQKHKNTPSDFFNRKSCLYSAKTLCCKASGVRSKTQDETRWQRVFDYQFKDNKKFMILRGESM